MQELDRRARVLQCDARYRSHRCHGAEDAPPAHTHHPPPSHVKPALPPRRARRRGPGCERHTARHGSATPIPGKGTEPGSQRAPRAATGGQPYRVRSHGVPRAANGYLAADALRRPPHSSTMRRGVLKKKRGGTCTKYMHEQVPVPLRIPEGRLGARNSMEALPHAPAGGPNNVVDLTADPVADEERAVSDGEAAESAVAAGAGADAGAGVGAPGGGAGPDGPGPRAHAPPATASPAKSSTGKRPREEDGSDDDDGHDQVRHPAPHLLPAAAPWAVHRWTRKRVHRWTRKRVHRWTRKRVSVRPGACGSPSGSADAHAGVGVRSMSRA